MPHVKFTRHLQTYFPTLQELDVDAATVAEVVEQLDRLYPGLARYIVDERGAMRKHVNVFIGEEVAHDRERLSDAVQPHDRIYIFQALSGG